MIEKTEDISSSKAKTFYSVEELFADLANENKTDYPIPPNPKIIKYWKHIEELKSGQKADQ